MSFASRLTLLAVAAAAALSLPVQAQQGNEQVDASLRDHALRFKPGELLVQFRAGEEERGAEAALAGLGAKAVKLLRAESARADGHGDLRLVALPANLPVAAAMRELRKHPAVEFAEPNWIYTKQAKGIDPYYQDGRLWGMYGAASPLQQN